MPQSITNIFFIFFLIFGCWSSTWKQRISPHKTTLSLKLKFLYNIIYNLWTPVINSMQVSFVLVISHTRILLGYAEIRDKSISSVDLFPPSLYILLCKSGCGSVEYGEEPNCYSALVLAFCGLLPHNQPLLLSISYMNTY